MNINLTLVVQMIVFALLTWFTMKFVWPIILGAMEERSKKIAAGLAAAEKGQQDFAQAHAKADVAIKEARDRANEIVDQANRRANEMIEAAKVQAVKEGERLLASAKGQIDLATTKAREELRKEVARLTVASASKVLGREIDANAHADIIGKLASDI
ncbi:MAG: F0F1 ATP synthase subunit B [Steroidobacteraceae bacterium]